MIDLMYLACRSLWHYWGRSLLLIFSLMVVMLVPSALFTTMQQATRSLHVRAEQTPMLLGASSSVTDLMLRSLYFEGPTLKQITISDLQQIPSTLATTIPLHLGFRVGSSPIVGTTDAYFDYRCLRIAAGSRWQRLGDCVLGHEAGKLLKRDLGDSVIREPESAFNISGEVPLKMRVIGILAPTDTPDDYAVFVQLETAWIIEGIGHGHEVTTKPNEGPHVASRPHNEVTDANAQSFHFHGTRSGYPLTAGIVWPQDARAQTLLVGRFSTREDRTTQVIEPPKVMRNLLRTVFRLRRFLVFTIGLLSVATAGLAILVFSISFQLRRQEFETMMKIGASPRYVAGLFGCEVFAIFSTSILLTVLLTWIISGSDQAILRWLL